MTIFQPSTACILCPLYDKCDDMFYICESEDEAIETSEKLRNKINS